MKRAVFISGGLLAILLSFIFDNQILSWVVNNRIEFLNSFMILITHIGSFYGVVFIGMLLFLYDRKWNNLAIYMGVLLAAISIGLAIKYIIVRARPDPAIFQTFATLIKTTPSFPSSHAIAVFSVYPIIEKYYSGLKNYWLVFAVLVLFSRLYVGIHYPSDVVFGAVLGYLVGAFIIGKLKENFKFLE